MQKYDLVKRPGRPLYEALYESIKRDIASGRLRAGEKLPSKRSMALDNDVSITTVVNAYNQLVMEGYLDNVQRKGYFVADIRPMPTVGGHEVSAREYYRETKWFADFRANNTLYRYFPYATWKKVIRQVLSAYETELVVRGDPFGIRELREQIARYLYRARGIVAPPECIVVGAGIEYLYARLVTLFPSDAVYAVENPGYQKIPQIYDTYGLRWKALEMTPDGIDMDELRRQEVDLVHVSPEHHYPLGVTMPMNRRQDLLRWADGGMGRYIIEDDFDCEFRYNSHPIPALKSLDATGRVIYMNTFSKTLSPAVRISYMVLPDELMERYIQKTHFFTNSTSSLEQYALAHFIEKGYFERHLNRIKKKYRQEGDTLLRILRESRGIPIGSISASTSGTHLLVHLDTQMSDDDVKRAAAARSVNLACLSDYCSADKQGYRHILILNYSDLEEWIQREAIRRLGEVFA